MALRVSLVELVNTYIDRALSPIVWLCKVWYGFVWIVARRLTNVSLVFALNLIQTFAQMFNF